VYYYNTEYSNKCIERELYIMRKEIKPLKELIEENKQDLLKDKKAMESIEKRIDDRHSIKRLA
jgi:hypothetical protein